MSDPTPKRCFVITPIGNSDSLERRHADFVFNIAIEPVFAQRGYVVKRADMVPHAGMINDTVFDGITNADICVADLSYLNPNVFYELGVRHALQLPTIHIIDSRFSIPFDNAGHNTLFFDVSDYHSLEHLRGRITEQIDEIELPGFAVSNPLTLFRGLRELRQSGDPQQALLADLQQRIADLERVQNQVDTPLASLIMGRSDYVARAPTKDNLIIRLDLNKIDTGLAFSRAMSLDPPSLVPPRIETANGVLMVYLTYRAPITMTEKAKNVFGDAYVDAIVGLP